MVSDPVPHPTCGEEVGLCGIGNGSVNFYDSLPTYLFHWNSDAGRQAFAGAIHQVLARVCLPVPVLVLDAHVGNRAIHEHIPHEAADAVRLLAYFLTGIVQRDQHRLAVVIFREV